MCKEPINGEEYAPITQELREYIERHPTMMHAVGLTDLCDNIDAIHKSLEEQNAKLREKVLNQRKQLAELGAENARLVDVLHEVEEEAVLAFNSLRQDCKTITDSSQHFFEKWWHAECEADRLKAENAKLREVVADMLHDAMENVCFKAYWCDEKNWQTCNDKSCGNHLYVDMARELGIGVDE